MAGVEHTLLVAAWDEHQRAIEFVDVVEKDRDVHGARFGHLVVVEPGTVVLVPLPDVAVKRHLAVDLELVHVDVFVEELFHRFDHARMACKPSIHVVIQVGSKVGAHHAAGFFAHVLGPLLGIDRRHLVGQTANFFRGEEAREKQVSITVKLLNLLWRQFHCVLLHKECVRSQQPRRDPRLLSILADDMAPSTASRRAGIASIRKWGMACQSGRKWAAN